MRPDEDDASSDDRDERERVGEKSPTNVLLVTVDSIRADHVPLRRDGELQTEVPERLAEDGVRFDSAFATGPSTAFSFPGILTGTLPLSYGGPGPLADDRPRLSGWLKRAGFETGGFHSNPFLSRYYDYDEGFDRFEDYQNPLMGIATKLFPRGIEINSGPMGKLDEYVDVTGKIKSTYELVKGKPRPYVDAEVVTDDAIDWLRRGRRPFFCWAHYMDVHHPCYPPERYRERFDVAHVSQSDVSEWYSTLVRSPEDLTEGQIRALLGLYRAAIAYTDDQVMRLLDYLQSSGEYDDTLVVYTSDHGELFGEYGQYGKPERMFDELLKVPLVVANGPDRLHRADSDLVSLLDIPGIIVDSLGVEVPAEYEGRVPGRDPPRDHVIGEHRVDSDVVLGVRSASHLYEIDEIRGERRAFEERTGRTETDEERTGEEETDEERTDEEGASAMTRVRVEDVPDRLRQVAEERLARVNRESALLEADVESDVESRLEDLGYL